MPVTSRARRKSSSSGIRPTVKFCQASACRRKSESLLFQGIHDDNYDGDPDMPLTYLSDPDGAGRR
jgi:hypothetical protein